MKFKITLRPPSAIPNTLCAIRQPDSSMIKLHGYLLCSCIFFLACVNRYQGQSLSELTINDKKQNKKIVNRYPDYGDGHRDGCIVMSEMRLKLLNKNGKISGNVTDVATGLRMSNVTISLRTTDNTTISAFTDSLGTFEVKLNGKASKIQLESVGYRNFQANL